MSKQEHLLLQSCQIAEVKTKMVQQTQVWLNNSDLMG